MYSIFLKACLLSDTRAWQPFNLLILAINGRYFIALGRGGRGGGRGGSRGGGRGKKICSS